MELEKRPSVYKLPSYSLTADLVGFMRCGLQYRFHRIGQHPSTQPVQLWFGQFIHGVLEEAFLRYRESGAKDCPPWPKTTIDEILVIIKQRLAAQGLSPRNDYLENLGDDRARVSINELGPLLFPLIHRAEVRLTGSRPLPMDQIPAALRFRDADRYEMVGVIDVVTHVQLTDPALQDNRLVQLILEQLPGQPPDEFEIILDYKGMRRPPYRVGGGVPSYWDIYGWQVQTYAHLRSLQDDSLPVAAGVIVYLNELLPLRDDLEQLQKEARSGETDVAPEAGSEADKQLKGLRSKGDIPDMPFDFRLRRALRVVPVTEKTVRDSLIQFDAVVARIEVCRGQELKSGRVLDTWEKNPADESTCAACDERTICPSFTKVKRPTLPGEKI